VAGAHSSTLSGWNETVPLRRFKRPTRSGGSPHSVVTRARLTTQRAMRQYLVEVNLMACLRPPSNCLKPDFPNEEKRGRESYSEGYFTLSMIRVETRAVNDPPAAQSPDVAVTGRCSGCPVSFVGNRPGTLAADCSAAAKAALARGLVLQAAASVALAVASVAKAALARGLVLQAAASVALAVAPAAKAALARGPVLLAAASVSLAAAPAAKAAPGRGPVLR